MRAALFAGVPGVTGIVLRAAIVFAVVMRLALTHRRRYHPFPSFGAANVVTSVRAALVSLAAGLVGEPALATVGWIAAAAGFAATVLDGVDGWLARRTQMASAFGARFDMEVDALLILVLAILAWQFGKAGPWVLASGLLRYAFVAGGWVWPWLARPLPPSARGRTICVVQIVALLVVILPPVTLPIARPIAAGALAVLTYSFLVDTIPTLAYAIIAVVPTRDTWLRWTVLAAALLLLNFSLSFQNVWPTPAIRWSGAISVELAAFILIVAAIGPSVPFSTRALRVIAVCWIALVIGHYADVTAPALYGRDINLYWDLRFVPAVTSMLVRAAPVWLVALAAAGVLFVLALMYGALRWAINRVVAAMTHPLASRTLVVLASAVVLLFAGQRVSGNVKFGRVFSRPVVGTYLHQARLVYETLTRSATLAASPAMSSDFSRVRNTDVLLLFIESYGAVTYERPELSALVAADRAKLDAAIRETNRDVVSAFVESPTFGGGSWLAHISLLSGIEVKDADTNARLMAAKRDTMVTAFARHGYRTVAMMPGMWQSWPEGSFYGFDEIYSGARLNYNGPAFGWWDIPDQYAIAKMDALELGQRQRPPVFVFFPTVSTHVPFTPAPPYQPDWARVLTDRPFDDKDIERAEDEEADWKNLGPGYAASVSYAYTALAGYLRERADRDFVMILIGDHQPPALVSGEGASWDVPIHVIAPRTAGSQVLARLRSHGFQPGLTPRRPSLGHMHALVPVLLDAFGDHETSAQSFNTIDKFATETPRH